MLLEFHNEEQIDKVLSSGLDLIGINNRNLSTVKTNISHCENLSKQTPSNLETTKHYC